MSKLKLVSDERREYINQVIADERLFAVIGTTGDISDRVADMAKALREGGVSTAEITCRSATWLKHLDALKRFQVDHDAGVVVAVGTNTDVYSVHQAMENGAEVIVAAHGLMPYINWGSIPAERGHQIDGVVQDLCRLIVSEKRQIQAFQRDIGDKRDPYDFMMDSIWYVQARGGVVIPASATAPDGLKALRARGAPYQKLYPTQAKPAEAWTEDFKAVTPDDNLRVVLTGGLEPANVQAYMKIPYVVAAGMSYLAKGKDATDTAQRARECRGLVGSR